MFQQQKKQLKPPKAMQGQLKTPWTSPSLACTQSTSLQILWEFKSQKTSRQCISQGMRVGQDLGNQKSAHIKRTRIISSSHGIPTMSPFLSPSTASALDPPPTHTHKNEKTHKNPCL